MTDGSSSLPDQEADAKSTYQQSLQTYRVQLIEAEQRSQATFDRTILTLSGGALGVSFAFVEKFTDPGNTVHTGQLLSAWICWIASLAFILLSHYFSTFAMRKTIAQVDSGTISSESPGGGWDTAIKFLNALGAITFLVGIVLITAFAINNVR